jgi:CRP-like cAMP-binding protein
MSEAEEARGLGYPWCMQCPLRMPSPLDEFGEAELCPLEAVPGEIRFAPAGTLLIRDNEPVQAVYVLVTGWAQRYLSLPNGDQIIVQLCFPSDHIGYHAAFLGTSAHYSAAALTAITYRMLDLDRVASVFHSMPEVARKFALRLMRRERIADFRLLNLARRKADERLALLLVYAFARQHQLGLAKDHTFNLPLSQEQIGDLIGVHAIHVNRMMRNLRVRGLVTMHKKEVQILDIRALRRFACFCAASHEPGPKPSPSRRVRLA